ncbi:MAG: hypothetical protein ACLFSU_04965 [Acholeplasmataceae bacterium]
MDLFVTFIGQMISAFFIAHITFIIFSRQRRIPLIILFVWIFLALLEVFQGLLVGAPLLEVALYFMVRVLPVIFALLLFLSVTGGLPRLIIKKKRRVKPIRTTVVTVRRDKEMLLYAALTSVLIAIPSYLLIDDLLRYVIPVLSLFVIFLSLFYYRKLEKVHLECIVLFIGRTKEKIYLKTIDARTRRLEITDFFTNDLYIVDPIGVAVIERSDDRIEKHHLFWIATGDAVDMSTETFVEKESLPYQDWLTEFEKYHYRIMHFRVSRRGQTTRTKNLLIR